MHHPEPRKPKSLSLRVWVSRPEIGASRRSCKRWSNLCLSGSSSGSHRCQKPNPCSASNMGDHPTSVAPRLKSQNPNRAADTANVRPPARYDQVGLDRRGRAGGRSAFLEPTVDVVLKDTERISGFWQGVFLDGGCLMTSGCPGSGSEPVEPSRAYTRPVVAILRLGMHFAPRMSRPPPSETDPPSLGTVRHNAGHSNGTSPDPALAPDPSNVANSPNHVDFVIRISSFVIQIPLISPAHTPSSRHGRDRFLRPG